MRAIRLYYRSYEVRSLAAVLQIELVGMQRQMQVFFEPLRNPRPHFQYPPFVLAHEGEIIHESDVPRSDLGALRANPLVKEAHVEVSEQLAGEVSYRHAHVVSPPSQRLPFGEIAPQFRLAPNLAAALRSVHHRFLGQVQQRILVVALVVFLYERL